MKEIDLETPVSKEETLEIEHAFNLGDDWERQLILSAAELAALLVKEEAVAWDVPDDEEQQELFVLALRVFMPQMEALRKAETN